MREFGKGKLWFITFIMFFLSFHYDQDCNQNKCVKGDREEGTCGLSENALPSAALFRKTKEVIYQTEYLWGQYKHLGINFHVCPEATIQFYDSYWMIWINCNYSSQHALWSSLSCKCVRGKCANTAVTKTGT